MDLLEDLGTIKRLVPALRLLNDGIANLIISPGGDGLRLIVWTRSPSVVDELRKHYELAGTRATRNGFIVAKLLVK